MSNTIPLPLKNDLILLFKVIDDAFEQVVSLHLSLPIEAEIAQEVIVDFKKKWGIYGN